jgi:hypothetical protein
MTRSYAVDIPYFKVPQTPGFDYLDGLIFWKTLFDVFVPIRAGRKNDHARLQDIDLCTKQVKRKLLDDIK